MRKAEILLETDGKKIYLWVNSELILEAEARHVLFKGGKYDEQATLIFNAFKVAHVPVTLTLADHRTGEEWSTHE